jgi:very-short-patch-repair endonuclease
MIITEFVETKIGGRNIKHYKKLGYNIKLYQTIKVPVYQLPNGSHEKIEVKCDYCGKTIVKVYKSLLLEREKSFTKKDCCMDCIHIKGAETNMILYGVDNCMGREEVREKLKNTMLNNFGVENWSYTPGKKIEMIEWYANLSEEDVIKRKEKIKNTMIEKYGVGCGLQLPKCREELFKTQKSASSQQIIIYNLIKNKYNNNQVENNFYYSSLCLDIFLLINNIKIDIEYDSWYWHNPISDRRRDEFLKSDGFKILRIKSSHKIPESKELFEKIEEMVDSEHKYFTIILDDWKETGYITEGRRYE